MSTWQSPPNFIFVSWAYVPNFRLVPWILPVDFGGGVVVLVVLVLVTGVKQSQLLDFKSWSRSVVWQKKNLKKMLVQKNFESQKMLVKNFFGQMKFGFKKVMGPKNL